jgi:MFS family permease
LRNDLGTLLDGRRHPCRPQGAQFGVGLEHAAGLFPKGHLIGPGIQAAQPAAHGDRERLAGGPLPQRLAATSFGALVAARACQGAFGALLAPAALSLLTTTFGGSKDRRKTFGIFGAIAGAGGAVGLLLGGLLTEYLTWRWCLYVNLIFAVAAGIGAVLLLPRQPAQRRPRLDLPGFLAEGAGMFGIVYGFSNAASRGWHAPATWGFLAAGGLLLAGFAWWETRAAGPLLPLRLVLDRNRAAAYSSTLVAGAGMFGIFLFRRPPRASGSSSRRR